MSIKKKLNWNIVLAVTAIFACVSILGLVSGIVFHKLAEPEPTVPPVPTEPASFTVMDTYDELVNEALSQAHAAAASVRKVYWIKEDAVAAPKPNEACYGETDDPSSLQWLLEDAAELLDGQNTVFSTDIELAPNSRLTYYFDPSILVLTWQQVLDNYVYTFSEVKITHPSQFRRYFTENTFNSDYIHPTSKLAGMVNAVMASSADFYRARNQGIVVYQGTVEQWSHSDKIDTCFIGQNGDLILVPAGTLDGYDEVQRFVDENNINCSVAFGPILVDNGVRCEPKEYYLGEIYGKYPRAALCQMDSLHYVVVMANGRDGYWNTPDIHMFAEQIDKLGCQKAYTLDGGKTGTISMQGTHLNPLSHKERWISDIIYFATAIPSTEP